MFGPALSVFLAFGPPPPAPPPVQDQDWVERRTAAGELLPFPTIVREAQRHVFGGTLIGSDFDRASGVYRMKFMARGAVTAVDIDGRTGEILAVEGR